MFSVLKDTEYHLYFDHIVANFKNSRKHDDQLIDKVIKGLEKDNRIIIFIEKDNTGSIISSIMTKKKISMYEYYIVNYRTLKNNFFDKKQMKSIFNYAFEYYENIGYYKWLTARPLNLLNVDFFKELKHQKPFNRYITAIEAVPQIIDIKKTIYFSELLEGIPDTTSILNYMIIAGFCKQKYRKLFNTMNSYYVK